MLDSHPQLAIPPESHFLGTLLREQLSPTVFLEVLKRHERFVKWDLPIEEVAKAYEAEGVDDAPSAIRTLYATYAARQGKPRWGDKTPGYVRRIAELGELLPEAHFIHIIRDGRDVVTSWMSTPFSPDTVEEAAEKWKRFVGKGRSGGAKVGSRYLEVRYESLVTDPEPVLREISDFIQLPFDPAMLDHTKRAKDIIASARNPAIHQRLEQPPTPGLRDWRREMDPDDLRRFESVAGDLLSELGYELST